LIRAGRPANPQARRLRYGAGSVRLRRSGRKRILLNWRAVWNVLPIGLVNHCATLCLVHIAWWGAVLGSACAAVPVPPATRPNIVFILADDFGYMDIGANNPKTFYETPNIDRIAAQGVRFTDGYAACPVCSPTRASILTGKYPARLHLTDFIGGRRAGRLLPADYLDHLPLEEVTLAEALKEAGYVTGFFGKWHLGGAPYLPEAQGFDVNVAGFSAGAPSSYFSPYRNPKLPDGPPGEYLTDRLTDEAVKFLETNAHRPFLLYLAHYAVHIPLQAKPEIIAKYKAKAAALPPSHGPKFVPEGDRQVRQIQDHPVYAAMVQSLDESVGRVLRKLDDLGIAGHTIVIFFSDNGGLATAEGTPTSNVPLRAGKGWLYEGGIREPMLIKWPGAVKPGSICSVPVTSTDFYPTILEMAGVPERPQQHRDGVSLVSLLKTGQAPNRPALFWHYPHYSNQGGRPGCAVRTGDWKLIRCFEDNRLELYNLREDLSEQHDLALKDPQKTKELNALLEHFLQETKAALPRPNPDYDASAPQPKAAKQNQPD
jgi:arylsulfatase A-like enzyme